ncbi:MAG: recombination mediator RecR [Gemmatimonadota bacterium]
MSAIDELATELARLPGIGRKTALRLTYHLLRQPRERVQRLAAALLTLVERVRQCRICGNLTEDPECAICRDPRRDTTVICAVEEAADIGAIERTGEFRGQYHVLGGRISPLDGVGPEDLTVGHLVRRVMDGQVSEVIVATNPSVEGEATALYLQQALRPAGVRITRIARGLPVGGDLEYADGVTIAQAISARRDMHDTR